MKLRNKKTGEILTIDNIVNDKGEKVLCLDIVPDGYELVGVPLIKDEKIRKAVRAWAEVNGIEDIGVVKSRDITTICDNNTDITFYGNLGELIDGAEYTIAELCGEEE